MKNFIQRYKNANIAIRQIRDGEWKPLYNPISNCCLTAHKDGMELWVGNGAWFCEIEGTSSNTLYFGLFFRHYVWWAAARSFVNAADKKFSHSTTPILK